jgi:DNA-directed RNA polymerase specialized sigma24 family protein
MKTDASITKENFDALLNWLSPDGDAAGISYENIRAGLIRYFYFKGCSDGENLADETINRVAAKIESLDLDNKNKPITIFYGFASRIFLEELRRQKREVSIDPQAIIPAKPDAEADSSMTDCLAICLQKLPNDEKILITNYYSRSGAEKFEYRKTLAEKLGISVGAMHTRVHRLRAALRGCIEKCLCEST